MGRSWGSHALHRFTVDEYHRLSEAGVLARDARIELSDGELVESLVTMRPPRAAAVVEITRELINALGEGAQVRA